MPPGFDEPSRKWSARLPFSSLRARLLLLLLLALLPVYGFIAYSVLESRQQAAAHARENALWLTRLMASEQKSLMEVIRQQLQSLAQIPVVRRWLPWCRRGRHRVHLRESLSARRHSR